MNQFLVSVNSQACDVVLWERCEMQTLDGLLGNATWLLSRTEWEENGKGDLLRID